MAKKEFLTTGEASDILRISRSTVTRKFDRGILSGKTNPITGERLISHESIVTFMGQYALEHAASQSASKHVVMVTTDSSLSARVERYFSSDGRIALTTLSEGCDALVFCKTNPPHVLIVDEDLKDIPSREVIKYIKKKGRNSGLKILCLAHKTAASQCKKWGADQALKKANLDEADLLHSTYSLLGIQQHPAHDDRSFSHQRLAPRIPIQLPVKVKICDPTKPDYKNEGEGLMDNISVSGVHISQMRLASGFVPHTPFRLRIEVNERPLKNWHADCDVARLSFDRALTAGVKFAKLSHSNHQKVATLVRSPERLHDA